MIVRLALHLLAILFALMPAPGSAQDNRQVATEPPAIPARIAIAAGFSSLDERVRCGTGRAESLYLTVQNEGTTPITIQSIRLLAPADLELCPSSGAAAVEAGRRAVVPLRVGTREAPRQGTMPLILEVELAATVGGEERTDRMIASDRVEIRIPGLSDALQLLGVPTLLLLPGMLALSACFLLFTPPKPERFALSSPVFWMLAIPLSLGLSWAYSVAAGWIGYSRDLAERFGLWDIAWIWIGSMAIGLLAGWLLQKNKDRKDAEEAKQRAEESRKRTLTIDDQPLDLFERLVRLKGFERAPQWSTCGANAGFHILPAGTETQWLVPQAVVRTRKPTSVEAEDWKKALGELNALITEEAPLSKLVGALRRMRAAGLAPLAWEQNARPLRLGKDDKPSPAGGGRYYVQKP